MRLNSKKEGIEFGCARDTFQLQAIRLCNAPDTPSRVSGLDDSAMIDRYGFTISGCHSNSTPSAGGRFSSGSFGDLLFFVPPHAAIHPGALAGGFLSSVSVGSVSGASWSSYFARSTSSSNR